MFKNKKIQLSSEDEVMTHKEIEKVFTKEKAKEQLKSRFSKAREILNDDDKTERFLQRLERKLKIIPFAGKKLSLVPTLASLFRNYVRKEYRDIPIGSMIAVTAALLYFVAHIDFIPDSIPVIGFFDDATVLAVCWKLVESDVKEYLTWRNQHYKDLKF